MSKWKVNGKPLNSAVDTWSESIEETVSLGFEPVRFYLWEMAESNNHEIQQSTEILNSLIDSALEKIDSRLEFIAKTFGTVRVVGACGKNSANIPYGTFIDVEVDPPEPETKIIVERVKRNTGRA